MTSRGAFSPVVQTARDSFVWVSGSAVSFSREGSSTVAGTVSSSKTTWTPGAGSVGWSFLMKSGVDWSSAQVRFCSYLPLTQGAGAAVARGPAPAVQGASGHQALLTTTRVITAAYDGLLRLSAVREQPGTFFRYTYDLSGNRTGVWVNGTQTISQTYNAADQVAGWDYDPAGNLLSDGNRQWTYDALGRMTSVRVGAEQSTYTYNGDGVLVRAQGSWGQNERYLVDLAAPLSQVLQVQQPVGTTSVLYGRERLGLQQGGATTWLIPDALGSVRQTADSRGTPGGGIWYDPWGQVEQGRLPTFGFAGEQHDPFTGQVYLRARWYAPGQGRFLSWRWAEDESNDLVPYSHHAYAYAHSSPFNWTDPTGKCIPYIQEGCRFREIHKPECIASWVPVVGQADCASLLNVNDFSDYWHGPAGAAALAILGILVPPVGVGAGVYFFSQSAQAWQHEQTPEHFALMALDGALLVCSLGMGGGIRPSAQGALAFVGVDAGVAQVARTGIAGRTLGQALLMAGDGEGQASSSPPPQGVGYLQPEVVEQIQQVVDEVGEPLYVVGSSTRKAEFRDIDYAADAFDPWLRYSAAWDKGRLPRVNPDPTVDLRGKPIHAPIPITNEDPLDFTRGVIEFRPHQQPIYYPPVPKPTD